MIGMSSDSIRQVVVAGQWRPWKSAITLPTVAENAEKLLRKLAVSISCYGLLSALLRVSVVIKLVRNLVTRPTANAESGNVCC